MRAMVFEGVGQPLVEQEVPTPEPGSGQLQLRVTACGICRTDLHVVDGDLTEPVLPLIPGHQIVGEITSLGTGVAGFRLGQRVGVPWLQVSKAKPPCWHKAGMALAKPPTSAINPSRHYSTSSSKRTTLPLWTNWPSRANPCQTMSTRNLRPT